MYALTLPLPFVLTIMSGMGSGGSQSQMRHTENRDDNEKASFFSPHCIKPVRLEPKYTKQNKKNNSTNGDAEV